MIRGELTKPSTKLKATVRGSDRQFATTSSSVIRIVRSKNGTIRGSSRLLVSQSTTFSRVRIEKPLIEVPRFVKLHLRPYEDGTYFLRLHNMDPSNSAEVVLDSEWKL